MTPAERIERKRRREIHQRFLIRVRRQPHGLVFEWYKRRRLAPGTWGWGDRPWRAYVSGTHDFREAKSDYVRYAHYWLTGDY